MSPVSPDASSDDSLDIELRSVHEITTRAALLVTLVRRAALEEPGAKVDDQDAFERETDRFELYSWAMKELGDVATEHERILLRTPAGELAPDDVDECLHAAVSANALSWALGGSGELSPGDDPKAMVQTLLDWAPAPWDEISRIAKKHMLRDEETLAFERERWELWHWRATLDPEQLEAGESLAGAVAIVARQVESAGLIPVSSADFSHADQPFRSLPTDEQHRIAELAEGYLIALNWTCGFGDTWDTVPLYPD